MQFRLIFLGLVFARATLFGAESTSETSRSLGAGLAGEKGVASETQGQVSEAKEDPTTPFKDSKNVHADADQLLDSIPRITTAVTEEKRQEHFKKALSAARSMEFKIIEGSSHAQQYCLILSRALPQIPFHFVEPFQRILANVYTKVPAMLDRVMTDLGDREKLNFSRRLWVGIKYLQVDCMGDEVLMVASDEVLKRIKDYL